MRLYYLSTRDIGARVLREGLRMLRSRGVPVGIPLLTNEAYRGILLDRITEKRHDRLYLVAVDIPRAWCRPNGQGKVLCMRDIPAAKIRALGWTGSW